MQSHIPKGNLLGRLCKSINTSHPYINYKKYSSDKNINYNQGRTGPRGRGGGVPPHTHCLIKFIRQDIDLYIRLSEYMKDNLQC